MTVETFEIRPMTPADLEPVLAVERQCYSHPWSPDFFLQELDNAFASVDLLLVGGELAGYLCSWLIHGELHVLNLATAPAFRRRGIGAALLRRAIGRALRQEACKAFLEVRVSNEAAVALYRRFGFHSVFRRPSYYPDGEDAWVMEMTLDEATLMAEGSLR